MGLLEEIGGAIGLRHVGRLLERPGDLWNKPLDFVKNAALAYLEASYMGVGELSLKNVFGKELGGQLEEFLDSDLGRALQTAYGGKAGFMRVLAQDLAQGVPLGQAMTNIVQGSGVNKTLESAVVGEIVKQGGFGKLLGAPSDEGYSQRQADVLRQMVGVSDEYDRGLGALPMNLSQYARLTGLADPFTGQGGVTNPYELSQYEQQALNLSVDQIQRAAQNAEARTRASLAARGITSGPALEGALQRIRDQASQQVVQAQNAMRMQVQQQRTQAAQTMTALLDMLSGRSQQGRAMRMQARGQEAAGLGDIANRRIGQQATMQENIGSLLGHILGRNQQNITVNAGSGGNAGYQSGGYQPVINWEKILNPDNRDDWKNGPESGYDTTAWYGGPEGNPVSTPEGAKIVV